MKDCGGCSLSADQQSARECALCCKRKHFFHFKTCHPGNAYGEVWEQSENLLPVSSGAVSQCVRHGEHNEKAVMCDRKWQVGRAGQRLSTKAIRGAGQERHEACLFYPHGSIEKHGHALSNQHLAWFKIFLTKSLQKTFISHWTWTVKTTGHSRCL